MAEATGTFFCGGLSTQGGRGDGGALPRPLAESLRAPDRASARSVAALTSMLCWPGDKH